MQQDIQKTNEYGSEFDLTATTYPIVAGGDYDWVDFVAKYTYNGYKNLGEFPGITIIDKSGIINAIKYPIIGLNDPITDVNDAVSWVRTHVDSLLSQGDN